MRRLGATLIAIAALRAGLGAVALISLTLSIPHMATVGITVFAVAQASDQLDGWLARRYSTPSVAGYLQDSISDKLFHVGCLLGLGVHFEAVNLLLWGILSREFIILAARVVTTNISATLARLRIYSIAYALAVRLGIFSFLLALFPGRHASTASMAGYGFLILALGVGMVGLTLALRSARKGGGPLLPMGAPEPH